MTACIMLQEMFVTPPEPGHCHASSILALPDGAMLAAWFAGTCEAADDVRICCARLAAGAGEWSAPIRIGSGDNQPHWNPVLARMPSGRVLLFFKVGVSIGGWRSYVCEYDAQSDNWSSPAELVPGDRSGGRGPVKNKPITLSNGWVLAPGSTECDVWRPFVDISRDDGRSWQKVPVELPKLSVGDKGEALALIQPSVWESAPGQVHMLLRSNAGWAYRSDSDDYGLTWSLPTATSLPNNNSGLDLVRMADGRLFLATNREGTNWGRRDELYLLSSTDNGRSWSEGQSLTLSDGLPAKGEYSYPAIIAIAEDQIALSYTWRRQCIRFQRWRV
jgi:predicted neuraminidase